MTSPFLLGVGSWHHICWLPSEIAWRLLVPRSPLLLGLVLWRQSDLGVCLLTHKDLGDCGAVNYFYAILRFLSSW